MFDDIFINGFPKTGNHALLKACELLGVRMIDINHQPYNYGFPEGKTKCVYIKRDPRNALLSWLRFRHKEITPGVYMANFRLFQKDTLPNEMKEFVGWLTDKNTLVVTYEALTKDAEEMKRIADYIGVPYIAESFERLEGLTKTYHKVHSDYKTIWTPELETFWQEEGGAEIQKEWGY